MARTTTSRQIEILTMIHWSIETNGFAPTIREIQTHFGFGSIVGVTNHLKPLERQGLLEHQAGRFRTLRVTPAGRQALGLGDVMPLPADVVAFVALLDAKIVCWKSKQMIYAPHVSRALEEIRADVIGQFRQKEGEGL